MTLAEIRGGVVMRLGPRSSIPMAGVDIEIHNACDDIRAKARLMGVESLDRLAYLDLEAGKDTYEWPEEAEEIRDVVCMTHGHSHIPLAEVGFRANAIVDWVGYAGGAMPFAWSALGGRRFRIMQPISTQQSSLLVRFFPGPKRMVKAEDEPNLPRQVHENLIPGAVVRMASYDGIALSHPASFDLYRRMMDERLELFLQTESVSGAANHIQDDDPYYVGGA